MTFRTQNSGASDSDVLQKICYGEMVFPKVPEKVGNYLFDRCQNIKVVWA